MAELTFSFNLKKILSTVCNELNTLKYTAKYNNIRFDAAALELCVHVCACVCVCVCVLYYWVALLSLSLSGMSTLWYMMTRANRKDVKQLSASHTKEPQLNEACSSRSQDQREREREREKRERERDERREREREREGNRNVRGLITLKGSGHTLEPSPEERQRISVWYVCVRKRGKNVFQRENCRNVIEYSSKWKRMKNEF